MDLCDFSDSLVYVSLSQGCTIFIKNKNNKQQKQATKQNKQKSTLFTFWHKLSTSKQKGHLLGKSWALGSS